MERETEFSSILTQLEQKYQIQVKQQIQNTFLDKWYLMAVRNEIDFLNNEIAKISNTDIKNIVQVILSRTVRSSRATTHADLATLKEPVTTTYYCKKHGKICKPLYSASSWWERYTKDTINRLKEFQAIKTDTSQICLKGDARNIDLIEQLKNKNNNLAQLVKTQKNQRYFLFSTICWSN